MLKEALQLIQETAKLAQVATVLPALNGDGRTAVVQIGGELKMIPLEPAPRSHAVHSLVDLILYARHQANASPIVWHGPTGVVLLTDDADRRDRVVFPLTHSERFSTLDKLAKERPTFQQHQFIRLLRVDLGLDNVAVVAKFRKLDFSLTNEGSGEVTHGMQRMSKAVAAKVQGIEELPEELDVPVPVYQQAGERQDYLVRCAVEIDTINKVFQLIPLPDELKKVVDLAQASIHTRLTAASEVMDGKPAIPVYYGNP